MQGAGCRVHGAGCRVQGAGCRVHGAGCRVQGVGSIQSHELLEGAVWLLDWPSLEHQALPRGIRGGEWRAGTPGDCSRCGGHSSQEWLVHPTPRRGQQHSTPVNTAKYPLTSTHCQSVPTHYYAILIAPRLITRPCLAASEPGSNGLAHPETARKDMSSLDFRPDFQSHHVGGGERIHPENARKSGRHGVQ